MSNVCNLMIKMINVCGFPPCRKNLIRVVIFGFRLGGRDGVRDPVLVV